MRSGGGIRFQGQAQLQSFDVSTLSPSPNYAAIWHVFTSYKAIADSLIHTRNFLTSSWFDTTITACSGSKAKKMSKLDEQWRPDDKRGSLFCMPANEEFEGSFTAANPYVFMQPVDDREEGHNLIAAMLKHRVASILFNNGFCPHEPPELFKLEEDFYRMKIDLERWAWTKTSDTSHFSKKVEKLNQAVYKAQDATEASVIWSSFVTNINDTGISSNAITKRRLSIFVSIEEKAKADKKKAESSVHEILPCIKCADAKSRHALSHSEATWRELLRGEGTGDWKKSVDYYLKRDAARSSPMSH